jgi:hypothetical protein
MARRSESADDLRDQSGTYHNGDAFEHPRRVRRCARYPNHHVFNSGYSIVAFRPLRAPLKRGKYRYADHVI